MLFQIWNAIPSKKLYVKFTRNIREITKVKRGVSK